MLRTDIENIRKEQRKLFKIQSKLKLFAIRFCNDVKSEFSKRWADRFGSNEYHLTMSLNGDWSTTSWQPIATLLILESKSNVSFDDILKLCRRFTADTGTLVSIEYSGKSELLQYITSDEEEEELEL